MESVQIKPVICSAKVDSRYMLYLYKRPRWHLFSRPCYDKYRRCPGWVGGGMKFANRHYCIDGRVQIDWEAKFHEWRCWRCDECNVLVLPYAVHYFSIFEWWCKLKRGLSELKYRWEMYRD